MKRFLLVAALALTSACHDKISGPIETIRDLNAAKERWSKRGFSDYAFTLQSMCFCAYVNPIRVIVVSDTVQSAIDLRTFQPVDRRSVQTVDGLFSVIDNGIKNNVSVEATFESTLGYPVEILYNREAMALDGGVFYTVSDFKRN